MFIPCSQVHRCGPGDSMRACHAAGPGSFPGRDKFPRWGFFRFFFLTCKTNVGKLEAPKVPEYHLAIKYHYQPSLITGANDLRCWRALKPQIYIYTMFTEEEQRSWLKIRCVRERKVRQCHGGLVEACGETALPYRIVTKWVRSFNEGCDSVTDVS